MSSQLTEAGRALILHGCLVELWSCGELITTCPLRSDYSYELTTDRGLGLNWTIRLTRKGALFQDAQGWCILSKGDTLTSSISLD